MRFSIKDLVITDENARSFEQVIDLLEPHADQRLLFLEGPGDAGKTTLMVACGTSAWGGLGPGPMYCHAGEVMLALRLEGICWGEEHLSDIGEANPLFVDNIEGFLGDAPLGPAAFAALINARRAAGLDTVVASRLSAKELCDRGMSSSLDGFTVLPMPSLSQEGRAKLAYNFLTAFSKVAGKDIRIPDNMLDIMANHIADECAEIEFLAQRIVEKAPLGITVEIADLAALNTLLI